MAIGRMGTGGTVTDNEARSEWGADPAIWQTVSAPFTPCAEDFALIGRACPPELLQPGAAPRILVLGVTQALIDAPWPADAELHAVDYDQAMIGSLWKQRDGTHCHCARWQAMPFPDAHFDLVVGDCSLNALPSLADYDEVLREIARVRRPGAPLITRFFQQSEPRLSLAGLVANTPEGLASAAKRLLVLIASANADATMHARDIPGRIRSEWGEVEEFLAALGQSPAEAARAQITYSLDQHLNFPTAAQARSELARHFAEIRFDYPSYDSGANCPIVSCR